LVQLITLTLAVLVSSASAGAFNQYYEHDTDPLDVAHPQPAVSPPAKSSTVRSGWWSSSA